MTEMVFKTFENPPLPQPTPVLDAATQQRWDAWADDRIEKLFDETLSPAIGQALAEIRKQLRDEFSAEIGRLRGEVEILRAVVSGEVKQLRGPVR
jgi:hypothetical protein